MYDQLGKKLASELDQIRTAGLYKEERIVTSPQSAHIRVKDGEVINMCANNYLGLANDPRLVAVAVDGLHKYGYGMASVRFICGTLDIHKELERAIAEFVGMEDAILYSSCFDANGGLFEVLLGEEDAVISDAMNHASIIDGVRLSKAKRFRYRNNDMSDLEEKLKDADAQEARVKMIATDGVFSMDGIIANLKGICDLAEKYHALVMVDDSHATGLIGPNGRGTHELNEVMGRVDIITSTLGKAMGGASGGFTASRREVVEMLRQRSRPYLFSNTLAPVIAYTTLKALEIIAGSGEQRECLERNCEFFRTEIEKLGYKTLGAGHPIVPIMLGDARLAGDIAAELLQDRIYVTGFSYPVVPEGLARIRVQVSAAHSREDLETAVSAFEKAGRRHGVI